MGHTITILRSLILDSGISFVLLDCVFAILAFEMAWSGWDGLGFFCSSHAVYFYPAMDLNLAFFLAQLGFTWLKVD